MGQGERKGRRDEGVGEASVLYLAVCLVTVHLVGTHLFDKDVKVKSPSYWNPRQSIEFLYAFRARYIDFFCYQYKNNEVTQK